MSDSTWTDPWAEDPEAVIERTGRWWHLVYITHGLTQYGPGGYGWHVFGRARAERKAGRELRRYVQRENRQRDITRLSVADMAGEWP